MILMNNKIYTLSVARMVRVFDIASKKINIHCYYFIPSRLLHK